MTSMRPSKLALASFATLSLAFAACTSNGNSAPGGDGSAGSGGGGGAGGGGAGGNDGGALGDDAALFAQAVKDFNALRYTVARGEFQDLLTRFPKSSLADQSAVYIGIIDFQLGKVMVAQGELKAFFSTYPTSSDADRARFWLGRCDHTLNDFTAALADFDLVITKYPTSMWRDDAQYWTGRTHYSMAGATMPESPEFDAALMWFAKPIAEAPTGDVAPEAQYWLGRTWYSKADAFVPAAFATNLKNARAELNKQLTTYPKSSFEDEVKLYLARCDFDEGDFKLDSNLVNTAKTTLQGVIAAFPKSLVLDELTYWLGRTKFFLDDFAGAQVDFASIATNWPKSKLADNAAFYVGRSMFSQGGIDNLRCVSTATASNPAQFPKAEAQFKKVETDFPTSNILDDIIAYEGRSQYEQMKYAAAGTTFARGLKLSAMGPAAGQTHHWLGRTQHMQGDDAAAIASWKNVLKFPQSTWVENAYDCLVTTYADMGDCANADSTYAMFKADTNVSDKYKAAACAYKAAKCGGTCP